jgi:hypothetical protein
MNDETREKIRTAQIINRLQAFALGEVKMAPQQVRGAMVLLDKTLPDLANEKISADPEHPLCVAPTAEQLAMIALEKMNACQDHEHELLAHGWQKPDAERQK